MREAKHGILFEFFLVLYFRKIILFFFIHGIKTRILTFPRTYITVTYQNLEIFAKTTKIEQTTNNDIKIYLRWINS